MAFFGVTKEKISKVYEHPNADALELAKLEGMDFQFVVRKDVYSPGDHVIYFPVDSVVPEWTQELLGVKGRLAGSKQDRIKTIRLRGEISQGIVMKLEDVGFAHSMSDELLTKHFGVIKYEPPMIPCKAGNLLALPDGMTVYDLESADRYVQAADAMMDERVEITEKLEGSNYSIAWSQLHSKIFVNQRRYTIQPIEAKEHTFWAVSKKQKLIDFVEYLKSRFSGASIRVYGEMIGPGFQGNIYRLSQPEVRIYDILINHNFLFPELVWELVEQFYDSDEYLVPLLGSADQTLRQWLGNKTIKEVSDGESRLFKTRREGIVIKPLTPMHSDVLGGRLVLKQRGPEYLARSSL